MSGPTLGQMIRAGRLCFHWSDAAGAFVRITEASGDSWLIEVVPGERLPSSAGKDLHVIWWEDEKTRNGVEQIAGRCGIGVHTVDELGRRTPDEEPILVPNTPMLVLDAQTDRREEWGVIAPNGGVVSEAHWTKEDARTWDETWRENVDDPPLPLVLVHRTVTTEPWVIYTS